MHHLIREAEAAARRATTDAEHKAAAQMMARAKVNAHKDYLERLPRRNQGTTPHHENPWGSTVKPPWEE